LSYRFEIIILLAFHVKQSLTINEHEYDTMNVRSSVLLVRSEQKISKQWIAVQYEMNEIINRIENEQKRNKIISTNETN